MRMVFEPLWSDESPFSEPFPRRDDMCPPFPPKAGAPKAGVMGKWALVHVEKNADYGNHPSLCLLTCHILRNDLHQASLALYAWSDSFGSGPHISSQDSCDGHRLKLTFVLFKMRPDW